MSTTVPAPEKTGLRTLRNYVGGNVGRVVQQRPARYHQPGHR